MGIDRGSGRQSREWSLSGVLPRVLVPCPSDAGAVPFAFLFRIGNSGHAFDFRRGCYDSRNWRDKKKKGIVWIVAVD